MDVHGRRAAFAPLAPVDGYLPIEDFALVGDGSTAALVGRDGAFLGNYPQAFSHVGLISSGMNLARLGGRR